jgi:hypothetical protein
MPKESCVLKVFITRKIETTTNKLLRKPCLYFVIIIIMVIIFGMNHGLP